MNLPPSLIAYRLLMRCASPLAKPLLMQRTRAGKEDAARRNERLGRPTFPRPPGQLVWLHGASVGESLVLASLIDAFAASQPELRFLVTTGTMTSAKLMAQRLPPVARHQYLPIDTLGAVRGFLDYWKPDLAVFAESELWPNLVIESQRRGIPMALVNARMNSRSLANWNKRPDSARHLLACFDWIGAADSRTRDGLENLTGQAITLAGNLKLEVRAETPDPKALADIRKKLEGRPVWLAASTHPGEEAIILHAHALTLKTHPDALLILAPRHPERGEEVARLIDKQGFRFVQRSAGKMPSPDHQIWLADTLGEMPLWYGAAPAALIAGSLLPDIGGHNPIEASQAGSVVISGEHTASFDDLYAIYRQHKAMITVTNAATITAALEKIWSHRGPPIKAARAAIAEASGGAMATSLAALEALLKDGKAAEIAP
ncbi:3-deoxy-D-manno-octulosonic acid transferase [uncultured Maricaulis sp.]|uniref:3-deoxy-D-manno-octulosonic acid transferase n=1 Tax=uncultured Maricaulis sp. TaxID=174710 RepID=UPI0030DA9AC3